MNDASTPRIIAPYGCTTPAAGVTETNPARIPEAKPRAVAFPWCILSIRIQDKAPEAAATCVAVRACAVLSPEEMLLPALKPNQPTQRRPAPSIVMTILLGRITWYG